MRMFCSVSENPSRCLSAPKSKSKEQSPDRHMVALHTSSHESVYHKSCSQAKQCKRKNDNERTATGQ
eukprot:m.303955 g.303955  ORF g.303955 m.303955 type:complete len:67 (+) comp15894_c0_seq18:3624-3824(+)